MKNEAQAGGWGDLAEDTIGFGGVEWRTGRDLLLRPRAVLDAYEAGGLGGGGRYARPFRFYLALCGVLMFFLFLAGGAKRLLEGQVPPDLLARAVAASGKSREAFLNDADNWMSLAIVPVLAIFYALAVAPLIKRWGRTGWRVAFRTTFALLCAWTVPVLPLGPLPYVAGFMVPTSLVTLLALAVGFWRMGRGRWWTRPWEGALKAVLVVVLAELGGLVGMAPVLALGFAGGFYGA